MATLRVIRGDSPMWYADHVGQEFEIKSFIESAGQYVVDAPVDFIDPEWRGSLATMDAYVSEFDCTILA